MLKKSFIVSLALLIAAFAFAPVENAEAKTRVHIGVGVGGYGPYYGGYGPYYGPGPYYGGYYGPGPYYGGPPPYYGRYYAPRRTYRRGRISCKRGKRIVRNNGYRKVRARDCRGKTYSFSGRKRGRTYIIKMRSRTGRIFRVTRR